MKLLSIAVPCYNSEAYMDKCLRSLLKGGEKVEIIIVDDGSKDKTGEKADAYAQKYPTIVKAVHQENGGHGEAVNTGLKNATGLYFKVVDSDDRVSSDSYELILSTLEQLESEGQSIDLLISNFVYDKQGAHHKKVMQYRRYLPTDRVFSWEQVRKIPKGKYLLMHSLIYRTQMLKDCGLSLPAHTFYVDNIFAYDPLPYVKSMRYLDTNFYLYFIGRGDQSVNESVMIKRIDQQLRVNRLMVDSLVEHPPMDSHCEKYMRSYLDIITTISSIMLIRKGTSEALDQKKALWEYIRSKDSALYRKLRWGLLGIFVNLPGRVGRAISVLVYRITQKIYGFN